jgi:hypothetical protein
MRAHDPSRRPHRIHICRSGTPSWREIGQYACVANMRSAVVGACAAALLTAGCATSSKADSGTQRNPVPPLPPGIAITVLSTLLIPKPLPSGELVHAVEIAQAIKADGLGCDEASIETGLDDATAGHPATEQLSCDVGDDTVEIGRFGDHAALLAAKPAVHASTCYVVTRQQSNATYVEGENWIVFPEQTATARRIAHAIGGALVTEHC